MPATHIALLRGINVGKAKRIAMADLRAAVIDTGMTGVQTLLNSGNVVFTTRKAVSGAMLRAAILARTGVDARTTVLTAGALATVMAENTLTSIATDFSRLVVYVPADDDALVALGRIATQSWEPEVMTVGSMAAYVWSPDGLLAGNVFELINKQCKDGVTARNWATMLKLQALVAD
ncbi:MAG: DUF1697 domain-containing protein [Gemmatimonadota bacterium]